MNYVIAILEKAKKDAELDLHNTPEDATRYSKEKRKILIPTLQQIKRELLIISEREKANELFQGISGSAYRDELLKKTESMEEFAKQNYEHKEYYEGLLNGLRNMRAHINNLYRKHYR